jgi:hypothetical protein
MSDPTDTTANGAPAPNEDTSGGTPDSQPPASPPARSEVHVYPLPQGTPTTQRSGTVNAGSFKDFDDVCKIIRIMRTYGALSPADKQVVETIIRNARRSATLRDYYLSWLGRLLSTEDAPKADTAAANNKERAAAVQTAQAKQAETEQMNLIDAHYALIEQLREEDAAADPSRVWTTLLGGLDVTNKQKLYRVDRSNLRNIVVQIKVHLRGTAGVIRDVEALEDDIEKHAQLPGYTIDVVFVRTTVNPDTHDEPDVFELNTNPDGWTDQVTWGAGTETLTHELHHLLGLDDRYDYIEMHSQNANMSMHWRLYWFDVQMWRNRHRRPGLEQTQEKGDPEGVFLSPMGNYPAKKPLPSDICVVVQEQNQQRCKQTRTAVSPPPPLPPTPPPNPLFPTP